MGKSNVSFWKIFQLLSFLGTWSAESLQPDEDGVVRLDVNELADLANGMCACFGWRAEIALPANTDTEVEGIIE